MIVQKHVDHNIEVLMEINSEVLISWKQGLKIWIRLPQIQ
jgi:hypothetical protein